MTGRGWPKTQTCGVRVHGRVRVQSDALQFMEQAGHRLHRAPHVCIVVHMSAMGVDGVDAVRDGIISVSYTHLTLPTKRIV